MKFLQNDGMVNPSLCYNSVVMAKSSGVIMTSSAIKQT